MISDIADVQGPSSWRRTAIENLSDALSPYRSVASDMYRCRIQTETPYPTPSKAESLAEEVFRQAIEKRGGDPEGFEITLNDIRVVGSII